MRAGGQPRVPVTQHLLKHEAKLCRPDCLVPGKILHGAGGLGLGLGVALDHPGLAPGLALPPALVADPGAQQRAVTGAANLMGAACLLVHLEVPHEPHVGVEHDLVHKVGPGVTVGWTGPLRTSLLGRGVPALVPNLDTQSDPHLMFKLV